MNPYHNFTPLPWTAVRQNLGNIIYQDFFENESAAREALGINARHFIIRPCNDRDRAVQCLDETDQDGPPAPARRRADA